MLPLLGLQLRFLSLCSFQCSSYEFLVILSPPRSPGLEPYIFALRHSLFSERIKKTYSFLLFVPATFLQRRRPPFTPSAVISWISTLPGRLSFQLPGWLSESCPAGSYQESVSVCPVTKHDMFSPCTRQD